jgi:hypothetical protein
MDLPLFLVYLNKSSEVSFDRHLVLLGAMISHYFSGEVHEQSVFTSLRPDLSVLRPHCPAGTFSLTVLPFFVTLALNPLFVE